MAGTDEVGIDRAALKGRVPRSAWYALALVSTAQGLSLLDRQILAILAPSIREDLGIGDAELGLLYGTVFALFYALFSLPLGRLVDGWIRTRLLAICIFGWSAFAGLSAFAQSFAVLAISRLGVGIGEGASQPAANSIIFDTFPRNRRGTAMAAMGVATSLGLGLSMVLGGVAAQWWDQRFGENAPGGFAGWQFAFLVAAMPGLLLAVLLWRMKEPSRGAIDGIPGREDPYPFRASAEVLGAVTPLTNWYYLWRRGAGRRQWAINLAALSFILILCVAMTRLMGQFSPRPPLEALGLMLNPHALQWFVVGFGAFVVLNLFQSLKLNDPPAYAVMMSPSLVLLMVVGGLQTSINYGVMGFTPSFLIREYGIGQAEAGLWFGLLASAIGVMGPMIAGPLSDVLTTRMGARGRMWLSLASLGISPILGIWTFLAPDVTNFLVRFAIYSLVMTLWLPPIYSLYYDLVLPRMRGITSSTYITISTLLGLGMGPYFVGIVSDRNGGDLGEAIISVNMVSPVIVLIVVFVLFRVNRDESTMLARARAAGEPV